MQERHHPSGAEAPFRKRVVRPSFYSQFLSSSRIPDHGGNSIGEGITTQLQAQPTDRYLAMNWELEGINL